MCINEYMHNIYTYSKKLLKQSNAMGKRLLKANILKVFYNMIKKHNRKSDRMFKQCSGFLSLTLICVERKRLDPS